MFHVARASAVVVAIGLAIGLALGVPAGIAGADGIGTTPPSVTPATPVTTPGGSTPSTTVPPPPPFTLPSDFGYKLLEQMQAAKDELKTAQLSLVPAQQRLKAAKSHDTRIKKQVRRLTVREQQTQHKLDLTRRRLRLAAAEAYIHAGSGQLLAAISSFANATSAVDVGSELHVIGAYGSAQKEALDDFLQLEQVVRAQLAEIRDVSTRATQNLQAAQQHLKNVNAAIEDAKNKILSATVGIDEFHKAATSALSPILGPSFLTAKQMADFVMANGGHPNITVPLEQLAEDYLVEGAATGVRGDVAFAQSILETGSFANPGSSATDNNFAGIGWCDGCAHGYDFPDARTGVRAQLQLLRIYVDPNFPDATYKDPILLAGSLKLGFRGKPQTWWDLWGTWATGALYGQRVYDIYERMVAFAATDKTPDLVPVKPGPPPGAYTPVIPTTSTSTPSTAGSSKP